MQNLYYVYYVFFPLSQTCRSNSKTFCVGPIYPTDTSVSFALLTYFRASR